MNGVLLTTAVFSITKKRTRKNITHAVKEKVKVLQEPLQVKEQVMEQQSL